MRQLHNCFTSNSNTKGLNRGERLCVGLRSNNSLTGSLPEEWSQLTGLYERSAQLNNLTGSVPAAYSNLTELGSVNLAHNSLNGGTLIHAICHSHPRAALLQRVTAATF